MSAPVYIAASPSPVMYSSPVAFMAPSPGPQQMAPGATPLNMLTSSASVVDCPFCGQRCVTILEYKAGLLAYLLCVLLCVIPPCMLGCCLFPFCMDGAQDVEHHCSRCGQTVAAYARL